MMLNRLLLGVLLFSAASARAAEEPLLHKQALFIAGDGGYPSYRIPALVVTPGGALLAACEARKTHGDWSPIDIVFVRSEDSGKTWSQPRSLGKLPGEERQNPAARRPATAGGITNNNPFWIADQKTGAVHLIVCQEYMRCFYARSDDDGKTFSTPVEITSAFEPFRQHYDWKVLATGPGHGVQLPSGRLIVPVWLSTASGPSAHRPSVITTIYSDDHGESWKCGDIVANEKDPLVNPSESVAVALAGGGVLLNIRSEADQNRRAIASSPDGATHWTRPVFDDELVEPICMASLCRYSLPGKRTRGRVLFSNPANLERADGKEKPGGSRDRKNLTVRLSYDECETWPVAKTLESGRSAYSDLAVGKDGTIYCLYEHTPAEKGPGPSIFLAKFNLAWLTDGTDSGDTIRGAE
jgi:sialidase-1